MEVPIPNFYFMGIQFIHLLALCLWVGGIVVLQFLVSRSLSQMLPSGLVATQLSQELFKRFSNLTLLCATALIVTSLIKFSQWEQLTPWNLIRYLAIAVMSVISVYTVFRSDPEMNFLQVKSKWLMHISLGCGLTALLMA